MAFAVFVSIALTALVEGSFAGSVSTQYKWVSTALLTRVLIVKTISKESNWDEALPTYRQVRCKTVGSAKSHMCVQGRSQVFIGGGARWGNVKFIHKTLLQNINQEKFLL